MSKSYQKKMLIKEAVKAYKQVCHDHGWNLNLGRKLKSLGWRVSHPGVDKFIAIKGPLVCKWLGKNGYSSNSIRDLIEIHSTLKSNKLSKYLPRIYVHFDNRFIIEQRCNMYRSYPDYSSAFYKISEQTETRDIYIMDLHQKNLAFVNNIPKIIDGNLR